MNVLNCLIGLGAGVSANITTATASGIFQKVFGARPDLERRLTQPSSPSDVEAALSEISGVLQALAGSGAIEIDGAFITALRSAHFEHQDGRIHIGNAVISGPYLQTGEREADRLSLVAIPNSNPKARALK